MAISPEVFYRREDSIETAMAIRLDGDPRKLHKDDVVEVLEAIGLTPDILTHCLQMKVPRDAPQEIPNSDGKLAKRVYETRGRYPFLGEVEISYCELFPEAAETPVRALLHEPEGRDARYGGPGFEIFYVRQGEATMFIPDNTAYDPKGDTYTRTSEGRFVHLKEGSLLIIASPTPNGWARVGEGFEFTYICYPPHREKEAHGRIREAHLQSLAPNVLDPNV